MNTFGGHIMDRNDRIKKAIEDHTKMNCESSETARKYLADLGVDLTEIKDPADTFEFVIARKWDPDDPNSGLCIYAYHREIQTGTMEDAKSLLDYVRRQGPEKDYHIYRISYERIG
jgi:hypothetical protein